uniref:Uncharacterized protein n=1 Tax=Macrostomum lignano TaxID=282301 RepID=A0A1I8JR12_9PLAT
MVLQMPPKKSAEDRIKAAGAARHWEEGQRWPGPSSKSSSSRTGSTEMCPSGSRNRPAASIRHPSNERFVECCRSQDDRRRASSRATTARSVASKVGSRRKSVINPTGASTAASQPTRTGAARLRLSPAVAVTSATSGSLKDRLRKNGELLAAAAGCHKWWWKRRLVTTAGPRAPSLHSTAEEARDDFGWSAARSAAGSIGSETQITPTEPALPASPQPSEPIECEILASSIV